MKRQFGKYLILLLRLFKQRCWELDGLVTSTLAVKHENPSFIPSTHVKNWVSWSILVTSVLEKWIQLATWSY